MMKLGKWASTSLSVCVSNWSYKFEQQRDGNVALWRSVCLLLGIFFLFLCYSSVCVLPTDTFWKPRIGFKYYLNVISAGCSFVRQHPTTPDFLFFHQENKSSEMYLHPTKKKKTTRCTLCKWWLKMPPWQVSMLLRRLRQHPMKSM